MKRSKFSEEQIIGILKQAEAGVKVGDICREKGISDATFYKWRSKCGGSFDIRDFKLYPSWGFSQLGFEFWNLGIIDQDFVDEFSAKLGEPVRVVWGTV